MRTWIPLLFVIVSSGCCHNKPLVIPERPLACHLDAVPKLDGPIDFDPPGCPPSLICMTTADANKLASYVEQSMLWMREATARCGSLPATTVRTSGDSLVSTDR